MANTYLQQSIGNGNRRTWTWSAWVKRSKLGSTQILADNYTDANNYAHIYFSGSDNLAFYSPPAGTWSWHPKYRDTSAWYHIVVRCDTTLATNSDRVRLYVNGELQSANAVAGINQNQELNFNASSQLRFGARQVGTSDYFDGLIAHAHFTDGYSYAPTEFGETDSTTGIWKPKTSPSVTYGTNGYFLDFANSSDMGNDISGNNNDFTVSGGTMTQTIDTPSNVFAIMNPLNYTSPSITYSNGNTKTTHGNAWTASLATLGVSSGKYYWEGKVVSANNANLFYAICIANVDLDTAPQNKSGVISQHINGDRYVDTTYTASAAEALTNGDIIGVALDLDSATKNVKFYKNGSLLTSGSSINLTSTFDDEIVFPMFIGSSESANASWEVNFGNGYFGQTAVASAGTNSGIGTFEFDVPNGYKALCSKSINEQEYS